MHRLARFWRLVPLVSVVVLLGTSSAAVSGQPQATYPPPTVKPVPTELVSTKSRVESHVPIPVVSPAGFLFVQEPEVPRIRIAPNSPPPTVADTKEWARLTLSPEDYAALDGIVRNESHWDPSAVNPRGGACGLGQAWPCSKLSDLVPDWQVQPIEQLRVWLIPYALHRYGSLEGAWRYWLNHGRW